VGNWGVEVGGGRDHVVENNIIVRTAGAALEYDQRLRDGMMVPRGWYSHGDMHIAQFRSLELSAEPWVSRYPRLSRVVVDINADPDHADAFFNPSYSSVRNNVAIEAGKLYEVGDAVYRFSDVTDNVLYAAASEAGWDEEAGNLSSDSPVFHALPGFRAIPAENIGIFR